MIDTILEIAGVVFILSIVLICLAWFFARPIGDWLFGKDGLQ